MKKLKDLLKESQELDYRRMNVGEEDEKGMTKEEKRAFVEAVAAYKQLGEMISHKGNLGEIHDSIKNIVENANNITLKETGDWFDRVTVQRHMKSMNESFKVFSNTIKEVSTLQQRMESAYDEIGEVLGKYYEIKEGNEFGAARAKAIAAGEDSFEVDGKSYKVTDVDDADKKNAEEFTNESVNEEEIKWNAVQNAIINFLKANTKILDKRVQAKDAEGVKGGLKSIISGLTNAQRSLNLESVNEEVKVGQMVKVVDNPHWEAAFGKKGPFKRKVKMIDNDNVFFTDGSNSSIKYIKEEEMEEGNEFGAARAKAIAAGQDTFQVGDKTFKVTDVDAEDKKNAEDFANESMKLTSLVKSKKSVNEGAHGMATKLVQSVINGQTSRVEGIPLSKPMAEAFMNWLRLSTYGRNYKDLPFYMLLRASFNWGLSRYIDSSLKPEYVKLSKLVADIEKKRKEQKA